MGTIKSIFVSKFKTSISRKQLVSAFLKYNGKNLYENVKEKTSNDETILVLPDGYEFKVEHDELLSVDKIYVFNGKNKFVFVGYMNVDFYGRTYGFVPLTN